MDEHVHDVSENRGEPPEDLSWLAPSVKAKLEELAVKRDMGARRRETREAEPRLLHRAHQVTPPKHPRRAPRPP
eukprot:5898435-Pyramimonas_sp.AAC.1